MIKIDIEGYQIQSRKPGVWKVGKPYTSPAGAESLQSAHGFSTLTQAATYMRDLLMIQENIHSIDALIEAYDKVTDRVGIYIETTGVDR